MYKDYICVYKRLCLPCAHILTQGQYSPAPLHEDSDEKLHRVDSSYIQHISEQMLISQANLKLLKCIGQGR